MSEQKERLLPKIFASISLWLKNTRQITKKIINQSYPGAKALKGAGVGIGLLGYVFTIIMAAQAFLPAGLLYFLIVLVLFPVAFGLGTSLVVLILRSTSKLPENFLTATLTGYMLSMAAFGLFTLTGAMMGFAVVILGALLGAGIWTLARGGWKSLDKVKKSVTLIGLVLGFLGAGLGSFWLLNPGPVVQRPPQTFKESNLPSLAETLPDPSLPGRYPVQNLTYGSGTDKRRAEFGEDVSIVSRTVDGSPFVDNWTGLRTMVWGFDQTNLPLNGRVWYPDHDGAFPLVLVVHGNHLAEDYSDPGYAYLCELLASHGNICVSVDQNFINGSFVGDIFGFSGLKDENDLRGWLLLEHLSLWSDMASEVTNPFNGKVDLSNIALIGHSRGGEAVAIASVFNRLLHYPDNAIISFDYGFDIKSIVAIAPIDRQYQPSSRHIPVENVNYFTLHGAHDMDVTSFDGYNAYKRTLFTEDDFFFKSTLYIWRANHGQFNTAWGENDNIAPLIWLYNRGQLISGQDQMKIAQVYINAFLQVTLHDQLGYLPLFHNYQTGLAWLPETVYINAYSDSQTQYLLTFEEDIDVTTGSLPGVHIRSQGLQTWREDRVGTKWGKMHSNSAVYLGWRQANSNTYYAVTLDEGVVSITEDNQLVLSAAQVGQNKDDQGNPTPIDFTLSLIDKHGEKSNLPLSTIASLQPEINAEIYKASFMFQKPTSEVVFQTYTFDLVDFVAENPAISIEELQEVRLVFNETTEGNIVVDNLGFRLRNSDLND